MKVLGIGSIPSVPSLLDSGSQPGHSVNVARFLTEPKNCRLIKRIRLDAAAGTA